MKKKITLLAMLAVIMTTSIFANPVETAVNSQVLKTFTTRFEGAKEISWNKSGGFLRASFIKDELAMSAYFEPTGELIGVSRNILSSQLPLNLKIQLKKQVADNWISELFEFNDGQQTTYYVTIENADQKITYKGSGSDNWSIYMRTKKS